jgi:hypothetical protein
MPQKGTRLRSGRGGREIKKARENGKKEWSV